jgi:hypothetical protein
MPSLEAVGSLFRIIDTLSQLDKQGKALYLMNEVHKHLLSLSVAPVEVLIGFYYMGGIIHQRIEEHSRAIQLFSNALEIMENVYGDCRSGGGGMGHPLGLLLCSTLSTLCEKTSRFAQAFRYCRKFEAFWQSFPFPSSDPLLMRCIFGDADNMIVMQKGKAFSFYSGDPLGLSRELAQIKYVHVYCYLVPSLTVHQSTCSIFTKTRVASSFRQSCCSPP